MTVQNNLNAGSWAQLLVDADAKHKIHYPGSRSTLKHGLICYDETAKSYVYVSPANVHAIDVGCQKLSYDEIIRITGRFIKDLETSNDAPAIAQALKNMQDSRKQHVKDEFCPLGRLIHCIVSFIKNLFCCLGCGSTEMIGDRYVRRLEAASDETDETKSDLGSDTDTLNKTNTSNRSNSTDEIQRTEDNSHRHVSDQSHTQLNFRTTHLDTQGVNSGIDRESFMLLMAQHKTMLNEHEKRLQEELFENFLPAGIGRINATNPTSSSRVTIEEVDE